MYQIHSFELGLNFYKRFAFIEGACVASPRVLPADGIFFLKEDIVELEKVSKLLQAYFSIDVIGFLVLTKCPATLHCVVYWV